jgi:leucyl-tRNA synthetase
MLFDHENIEKKWQKKWEEENLFSIDVEKVEKEKKCYCLVMFAYPSGDTLHCGHWFNYSQVDSWARFKHMNGFEVFQPYGYDSFGLPAENYAIKMGMHPKDSTEKNVEIMNRQQKRIGMMVDWRYQLQSHSPEYYKWTQWIFLELYKKGLAYKSKAPVNWCDSCDTVLANEQVVDGRCERCDTEIYKKNLSQWFFKITDYAEELLSGHKDLDWPQKTILMQKNWIGKSTGSEIVFKVSGKDLDLKVFTTRPDTLFGVTYVSIAPEHPEVLNLTTPDKLKEVKTYISESSKKTETERLSTEKSKTGVFTGSYVINPINNSKVPLWVADYVIYSYGTGAVMAVPAHDERDFLFARSYNLPVKKVILEPGKSEQENLSQAFMGEGKMISSDIYNGLANTEGGKRITEDLEKANKGSFKTTYRLRDWLISRQRYWGAPIPIIYCDNCGEVPVPHEDLPVKLPYDVKFTKDGKSPLSKKEKFLKTTCPKCGKKATRETDTLDTFVCSSWYYLRFPDNKNENEPFSYELINKMLPVDKYIGGSEHACMHLLYSRFITKALADAGHLNFREPFPSLIHQGIILAPDGNRMSKSKGNTISPDSYVDKFGSDVFRTYLMFGFNFIDGGPWADGGIKAVAKFLDRVWTIVETNLYAFKTNESESSFSLSNEHKEFLCILHNTIKSVTFDTERFSFNTSIARLMELINAFKAFNSHVPENKKGITFIKKSTETLIILLAPFAPHLAEELWEKTGHDASVFNEKWPQYDPQFLLKDEIVMAVQINGRVRAEITVSSDASDETIKQEALKHNNVEKHLYEKEIKKIIVVKKKLVSIVAK